MAADTTMSKEGCGGGALRLLLRVAEHLRTRRDDDDGSTSSSCPVQGNANYNNNTDMRVSPTLPPLSAVAALRSFEPLDDLMARFCAFREQTQRCMRSCAKVGRVDGRGMQQVGMGMGMSGHDGCAALVPGFSFAQCMVQVANPTFALLQPHDAKRCVAAFVEKAAAVVSGRRQELLDALGQYNMTTTTTLSDAFESLRDPVHAVSDEGLNDAVLLHMSKLLHVCIVVGARSCDGDEGEAGGPATYRVFPPAVASDAEPAVLVSQGRARYELVHGAGPTLHDVQQHLLAAAAYTTLLPTTGLQRKTKKELVAVAERLAVPLLEVAGSGGAGRATARARTKGELLAAVQNVVTCSS